MPARGAKSLRGRQLNVGAVVQTDCAWVFLPSDFIVAGDRARGVGLLASRRGCVYKNLNPGQRVRSLIAVPAARAQRTDVNHGLQTVSGSRTPHCRPLL